MSKSPPPRQFTPQEKDNYIETIVILAARIKTLLKGRVAAQKMDLIEASVVSVLYDKAHLEAHETKTHHFICRIELTR